MKDLLLIKHAENNKRHLKTFIAAAIVLCILSGTAWSIENYSVGNPVGPGTVPPSSISSGLIRSPNPVDNSGNLIITGNVSGGKYFRGSVPYRSTTSFWAPLGSASLSPFLRDSASSDNFDRYLERYKTQPYYSPSETVTTTVPGSSGILTPSSATRIAERAPETFGPENEPTEAVPPQQSTVTANMRLPTPLSPRQIEKLGPEETASYPRNERLISGQYEEQMQQLQRELERIKNKAEELKQKLEEKDESLQISPKAEPGERAGQQLELPDFTEAQTPPSQKQPEEAPVPELPVPTQKEQQLEQAPTQGKERLWGPDIYERVKQQLSNLQTSQPKEKPSAVTEKDTEAAYSMPSAGEEQLSKEKPSFEILPKDRRGATESSSRMLSDMGGEEDSGKKSSALEEVKQLSADKLSAEAKRIMGPYKDIESFSEAKFNQHILAAQTYLKEGKFYRAADSYALASIYKKDNPATYAGRGHALFAAGEYTSSALFISRAIELSAAYAKENVDLVTIFGDRDIIESRIADVEEWCKRSDVAELRFLLGYVYYRIGRLDRAKQAIDTACEKSPQWPAAQIVKKAVDEAIEFSKTR